MKIVKPSVEIWHQQPGLQGMYKHVERCARVCYGSVNKGTVTAEQFVKGLIKRDELRPLEFGTVFLKRDVPEKLWRYFNTCLDNPWIELDIERDLIITNLRYVYEHNNKNWDKTIEQIEKYQVDTDPEITAYHRPTFLWHISRGIADEFRTHVALSSLMESTRYVNYKDGIPFAEPQWVRDMQDEPAGPELDKMHIMWNATQYSWTLTEMSYRMLLLAGMRPENARYTLPLGIATTLVQCGFNRGWSNFFDKRCDKAAHPDARYIAEIAQMKWHHGSTTI